MMALKETAALGIGRCRWIEIPDALEQLYRDRYRTFRDVLAGVVGSHDLAREVVQEAFARGLCASGGSFEGKGTWRRGFGGSRSDVALKTRRELRREWELDGNSPLVPVAQIETSGQRCRRSRHGGGSSSSCATSLISPIRSDRRSDGRCGGNGGGGAGSGEGRARPPS